MELRRQDGIDKQRNFKLDQSKQTHLASYETYLKEDCKISFQWYSDEQHLKWRDLTGPEKHRLFCNINISTLFPKIPKCSDIQALLKNFYTLMKTLSHHQECSDRVFQEQAQKWVTDFCAVYQTRHATPYIHAFAMHVPEFIRLHGNISRFSEQGLEKLNDLTTKHYLRSTNHKDMEALHQLIEKRNRLEYPECTGYQRTKRKCTCSICGNTGQNKRKCLEEITNNEGAQNHENTQTA